MTDEFRPTSSADAHAESMADDIPFVEQPADVQNPHRYNTFQTNPTASKIPANGSKQIGQSSVQVKKVSNKLINTSQLKELGFYQALLCEYIGTMLLVIVCTSTGLPIASKSVPDLNGALASGLIVATIVVGFGYISGAHINPAVTTTFLVVAEIDFIRAFFYMVAQILGAISGSGIVHAITPVYARSNLGMTLVTPGVTHSQAFVVEFLITFILCYTVHAICDRERDDVGGSKALAAGFAVTIGCLFGGPYTGASMNPARSFGPALVMNNWQNHWVYWLGPLAGSIAAGLVYKVALKKHPERPVHNGSHHAINQSEI